MKTYYFLFILFVNLNCSNQQKTITSKNIYGDIIEISIGNYKEIYNQGHFPFFKSRVRLINNTNKPYLICNSTEDFLILENSSVEVDSFSFYKPILVKPNSIDTIIFAFPIIKNRKKIIPNDYVNGNMRIEVSKTCNADSSLMKYFPILLNEIEIQSIKRVDVINLIQSKKTIKMIDREVIN